MLIPSEQNRVTSRRGTLGFGDRKITVQILLLTLVLAGCDTGIPEPSERSRLTVNTGELIGFENEQRGFTWKGIPFAEPPVGAFRWRAPQSPQPWSGTLEALQYGPACIQPDNIMAGSNAPKSEHVVGSEDCLTLNVFAPKMALEHVTPLPVLFWVHGGGNLIGSAQAYDGSLLASRHKVIVVTTNYRLGLLGWLRHNALRSPSGNAEDHSGNYGTLDIIAALKWVQSNIAAFGGNPNRVTIFGESAGGRNIWSMVQSALAKDLFHGAIVQSGSLKIMDALKAESIDKNAPDYPSYQNNGSELVANLDPDFAERSSIELATILRRKTPDDIYAAAIPHPRGLHEQPRLFLDGYVFTNPALELFQDPLEYNSVPIITGTNRDEDKLFMMMDERWVDFSFGILPKAKDAERYDKAAALNADIWRTFSVDKPAAVISQHGGAPVYTYRFDFDDLSDAIVDLPQLMGAAHGLEVQFVFGNHNSAPWKWIFTNARQRTKLADAMMSYWAEFAYSGNPGRGRSGELPIWTQWRTDGEHIILFDTANDGGVRMVNSRLHIDDIKRRLMNDFAFTKEERCEAYSQLLLNGFMITDGYIKSEHKTLCSD